MATRHETRALRLYLKTPGSDRLRKGAAAELGTCWPTAGRRSTAGRGSTTSPCASSGRWAA
jgi:hypothetical protein